MSRCRWFLGLKLTDRVPDHSMISLNRCKRVNDFNIFQEICDEMVLQGMKHSMISGTVLMRDSTHIKENASNLRLIEQLVLNRLCGLQQLGKPSMVGFVIRLLRHHPCVFWRRRIALHER
ncbi:hypothetical protein AN477_10510 [Alicyclobacillus ferrooxydans]|uniref:Uncharacterized protein n=1 Tax=Alicyclobacillus ferrooxydans TaxID=471514 RepID=A0A0P9CLC1_9BACL|nr:hypothetical protein AN477_10510 [Alicyclobacillus ferrooxydans]